MQEKNTHVSDVVYREIEEKILSGQWTPGTKITSEIQLAKNFSVSRMSVREAIEKMVALNILRKKKGGGTYVNEITPSAYLNGLIPMMLLNKDNLLDVLEFRKIIEVDSAKMCAERCEDSTIEALEACYKTMERNQNSTPEFAYADYQFHMEIAKGTKNSMVEKINSLLTDLWTHQQKELNKYLGSEGGIEDHKKILGAIKNRDAELAAIYMRRHIDRTIHDIENILNDRTEEKRQTDGSEEGWCRK